MNKVLLAIIAVGVAALVYAGTSRHGAEAATAPKNLKVLPKSLTKQEVKKIMKGWAKALDVECEHCHDEDDMAKDTPKKETARKMVRMVTEINDTYLKDYDGTITCMTCHDGHEEPLSEPPEEPPPAP